MASFNQCIALVFLAFLCISKLCVAQPCTTSNMHVTQKATGATIGGAPEYEVTVANDCICSQSQVLIQCDGLGSKEAVDTAIVSVNGNNCLVNGGNPIFQGSNIKFKYAWDTQHQFQVVSSHINCS